MSECALNHGFAEAVRAVGWGFEHQGNWEYGKFKWVWLLHGVQAEGVTSVNCSKATDHTLHRKAGDTCSLLYYNCTLLSVVYMTVLNNNSIAAISNYRLSTLLQSGSHNNQRLWLSIYLNVVYALKHARNDN